MGAGRTDAKVSALDTAFELFLEGNAIDDTALFLELLNTNLPPDICALNIKKIDASFNVIKDVKQKEYVYLFSHGAKNHPFCAPFLANILEPLDIDAMKTAAALFEGTHDFTNYTGGLQKSTKTVRTIISCRLQENKLLKANFFPDKSYALKVQGKGFMRYQVRMIAGALIQLGKGELTLADVKKSLEKDKTFKLSFIAPASGLLMHKLDF